MLPDKMPLPYLYRTLYLNPVSVQQNQKKSKINWRHPVSWPILVIHTVGGNEFQLLLTLYPIVRQKSCQEGTLCPAVSSVNKTKTPPQKAGRFVKGSAAGGSAVPKGSAEHALSMFLPRRKGGWKAKA